MGRPIVGGVSETQDYYTILGLSENCSQDDVLRAYYRLSQMYKTGNTNDPDAQQKLQKIIEAYGILSNTETRRQYDYLRKFSGSYQPSINNYGYPTGVNLNGFVGDFPFQRQFGDGIGGNAYVWNSPNMGGSAYGWGPGNGVNGGFAWGGMGGGYGGAGGGGRGGGGGAAAAAGGGGAAAAGGGGGGGGAAAGGRGGATVINGGVAAGGGGGRGGGGGAAAGGGGGSYGENGGSGSYGWRNDGGAWAVGGGDNGGSVWTAGGSAGVGGNTVTTGAGAGGSGDSTYEYYTVNGCTVITRKNGDSVTTQTICD
ncbi:hypothetical protein V9T40_006536 [Parthenolecanium corni]|uniref:J domain-containing protein n=1 Tax=Parthenolecanium corni TaxID=536013 RepID=A0AAN9TPX3_9HEMI